MTTYRAFASSTGTFALIRDDDGMRTTWIEGDDDPRFAGADRNDQLEPELAGEIAAALEGQPGRFDDIATPAGPPFFRRCWEACRRIPRGETITYADLAAAAGSPGAVRAAGQAMRQNPLPIVIPCHRVVASDGGLGGFSGTTGDAAPVHRKRRLLEMEGARRPADTDNGPVPA